MKRRIPKVGTLRLRKHFLWLPKTLKLERWGRVKEMRWLEFATWFEEWQDHYPSGWRAHWWYSDELAESFQRTNSWRGGK